MADSFINNFNPIWRDDIFDKQALDIHLYLPDVIPENNQLWVEKQIISQEFIFGHLHTYASCREMTSLVKPSDMADYYQVRNEKGEIISSDHPVFSYMFPPQAWMSDIGEELCMMFAAAKFAKGRILVGGLGLGIYPQFVFSLNCPVESITIVERDPVIIRLITEAWLGKDLIHRDKTTIIEGTIEEYLQKNDLLFDTIYLDTWEDADPRFLAHINYLLKLAHSRISFDGDIKCWGYAQMIDTFVENAKNLTRKSFLWNDYHLDPVLQAYSDWLSSQNGEVTVDAIKHAARECAVTINKSIDTYDRHRCFTGYGRSLHDAYRNSELSRKVD